MKQRPYDHSALKKYAIIVKSPDIPISTQTQIVFFSTQHLILPAIISIELV